MRKRNFRTDRNFTESYKIRHNHFRESDYDISIKYDHLDDALLEIECEIGEKELLKSLIESMSEDELKTHLEYICLIYDIKGDFLESYNT